MTIVSEDSDGHSVTIKTTEFNETLVGQYLNKYNGHEMVTINSVNNKGKFHGTSVTYEKSVEEPESYISKEGHYLTIQEEFKNDELIKSTNFLNKEVEEFFYDELGNMISSVLKAFDGITTGSCLYEIDKSSSNYGMEIFKQMIRADGTIISYKMIEGLPAHEHIENIKTNLDVKVALNYNDGGGKHGLEIKIEKEKVTGTFYNNGHKEESTTKAINERALNMLTKSKVAMTTDFRVAFFKEAARSHHDYLKTADDHPYL